MSAYEFSENDRTHLLSEAAEDCLLHCQAPDEEIAVNDQMHKSDQYWIQLFAFSPQSELSHQDARRFIREFRLSRNRSWDYQKLCRKIHEIRAMTPYNAPDAIEALTDELGHFDRNGKKPIRLPCAATKLSLFSRPRDVIFIWDSNARRAIAHRIRLQSHSGTANDRSRSLRSVGYKTYPEFFRACQANFNEELEKIDFFQKAQEVIETIRSRPGIMSQTEAIPDEFIVRRFFDKLMFHEGKKINDEKNQRKKHPRD